MQSNYKFVLFSSLDIRQNEFRRIMYNDVIKLINVEYIDDVYATHRNAELLRQLHRIHYHGLLNKYFELPLKSLWNKVYYNEPCAEPKHLCFVFFMDILYSNKETFLRYLKRHYPSSRFVLYVEDLIASRVVNGKQRMDLSLIDKYFDLTLSYDKGDCEKYGFIYYPTPYSAIDIKDDPKIAESDLYFCGAAKQRYDAIVDSLRQCKNHDIKTDYIVTRLLPGQQEEENVNYVSYLLPYSKYLEHLKKANCQLEIIQEGSIGFTVRVWESLAYGKKLLTNNPAILEASFCDLRQFRYFSGKFSDADYEFIKSKEDFQPRWLDKISPVRMLEFIEEKLENK